MRDDELRHLLRRAEHEVADQVLLSADGVRGLAGRIRRRRIRTGMAAGALGVVLAASVGVGVGVGNWGAGPSAPAGGGEPTITAPSATTVPPNSSTPKRPKDSSGPQQRSNDARDAGAPAPQHQGSDPGTQQSADQPDSNDFPQQHTTEPPPEPQPEPQLPVAKPAVDGDVDGDGTPDAISIDGSTVLVQASTAGALGVGLTAQLPPEVVGSKDVDTDGYADVWVKTDQVGLMSVATLIHSTGKALTATPLALPYGGGVEAQHLLSCDQQGTILGWSGTSTDAITWTGTTTSYGLDGISTEEQPTSGPKPTLPGILGCGITLPPAPEDLPPVTAPAADGDVDGDGQPDELTTDGPLLVVQGTRAGRITAEVAGTPMGAHDVDGDGYAEVFVDAGATVETLRFDGRDLLPFASRPVSDSATEPGS